MTPEIKHLSYSSVSSYLMCAAAWKFRYIDKIQMPKSTALVFGSAFHDTIEAWLGGKAESLTEAWREQWQKHTEGQDIINDQGQALVTSWAMGDKEPTERWV